MFWHYSCWLIKLFLATRCVANNPQDSGLGYTFIRVGEVVDGKEGGAAMAANLTDTMPMEQVVRDDIVRLSAESFMIENATNKVKINGPHHE